MTKTTHEIIKKGYQALVDSLGVVDTIRFIQHFSTGEGDYTQERHHWLDNIPLDDVLISIKEHSLESSTQYEEIIE
ncbi:hypothetical protein [[Phormidium] sp. ETS-05]|uniref:hypothetical protein n=1 Tax=[Phormidium] sp. ETS-05 TaxID=222819 RepID=UPI0018EF0A6A|nr:hypothetical protein [[Phormidium] sp. ETS-05]